MLSFRFTKPRSSRDVALLAEDTLSGQSFAKTYTSDELYPLQADRYYKDLPNLFVDVLDLIDGFTPQMELTQKGAKVEKAPSVTLRTLTRRAARAAADGSGNAQRFSDAKELWRKMESHVLDTVITADAEPIVDVRKSKNWRKNQPLADVRVNPQAWFVTDVFSRSNQQKNPIDVYCGLSSVFDALLEGLDDLAAADLLAMKTGISDNLNFPSYAQISKALNDSNMLVFHNDASLAAWIRDEAKKKEYVYSGTPAVIHLSKGTPSIPGDNADHSNVDVADGATITASNLANRISPKTGAKKN